MAFIVFGIAWEIATSFEWCKNDKRETISKERKKQFEHLLK